MKRRLWIVFLLVAAMFASLFCASCKRNTPPPVEEGPETGTYYFDGEGKEYLITLYNGHEFTFDVRNSESKGEYTLSGSTLTFKFSDKPQLSATYANETISLVYEGTEMRFLRKVEYTVTFETNGGSAIAPATVLNGKTASKPTDPVRANYVFIGWYKDGNFTAAFDFATPVTANTTVYARWIQKSEGAVEFTVDFNLNYAGATNPESTRTIGGRIYNTPSPVRGGYVFLGWFVSQYDNSAKLSYKHTEDTVFCEDATLFALWRADAAGSKLQAPVVTVNGNSLSWDGIIGASSYRVFVTGPEGFNAINATVGATTYTLPFNTSPAGDYVISVTAVAASASNNSDVAVRYYKNKALARVSHFSVVDSTLLFNGVANAQSYLISAVCGNPDHSHTLLDNGNSTSYNFGNCDMPKDGITFTVTAVADGYAPSTSRTFTFSRSLDAVSGFTVDNDSETLHWSAVQNAKDYVVEITGGGKTDKINVGSATGISLKEYGAGTIVIKVTARARGYYSPEPKEYSYNKTSLATPTQIRITDTTLTWAAVNGATGYSIRIGDKIFTQSGTSFELGHAIEWMTDTDYTLSVRADGAVNSAWSDETDIRYYSMCSTLTYFKNNVSWHHVVGASHYEVKVNDGAATQTVGDNFARIVFTQSGANIIYVRYFDGQSYSDWATLTVTAYELTFDSRSGSDVPSQYKAVGDTVTLPSATRGGYEFAGWYNVPGGATANGAEYEDGFYFEDGRDITLYANWAPKKITARYNDEIGDLDGKSGGAVFGENYTLDVPSPSDGMYAFVGWFTEPYGGGAQLTDENGKSLLPWYFPEETDVYAYWAQVLEFKLLQNGTWSVIGGQGAYFVTGITIPYEYEGEDGVTRRVTVVDGYAFSGCARLLSVEIPNTVTVVEASTAFYGCSSLTAVNVYKVDGVIDIVYDSHDGALIYHNAATSEAELVYFPVAKSGAYEIPEGVTELPLRVFANTAITAITIPASMKNIRERAFQNCINLTSIYFTSGGKDDLFIESEAFLNCYKLPSITMPARLLNVDVTSFTGCTALTDVFIESGSTRFIDDNGVVFNRIKDTLLYYPTGRAGDYTIPAGIKTVAESAFANSLRLTAVTIPGGFLAAIDDYAFYNCTALTTLTFSSNALVNLSIGNYAFYGNTRLSSIVFEKGSNVKSIGNYAFANCTVLGALTIPSSLSNIGNNAFDGDYAIKTVTIEDNTSPLSVGGNVFNNCTSLTTVYLPANLAQLQLNIFDGCKSLQNVYVSLDSEQYGDLNGVLYNRNLTEILYYPKGRNANNYTLPSTVTAIGDRAFEGNKVLTGFNIPAAVTKIGNYAFANCPNLDAITFEQGTQTLTIGDNAFANCTALSSFAFPERTKSIGNYALYGSTGVKSLTLPSGLETIGSYAFYKTAITDITLPEGITGIGSHAFSYTPIEELLIPASVVTIGSYAFDYCTELTGVRFAANSKLETIGSYAFQYDTALKEFTVPNLVKNINAYAFQYCSALTDLTFDAGNKNTLSIGNYAFQYCKGLERLDFPLRLLEIGSSAFDNCSNISQIGFAENCVLMTIGSSAFSNCSSLTEITIPGEVCDTNGSSGVGDSAFYYCSNLKTVTFLNGGIGTLTFGRNVFCYDSKLESVILPSKISGDAVKEQYGNGAGLGGTTVFKNCTSLKTITIDGESSSFAVVDGVLYTKDMKSLILCPAARTQEVVIPNTVTFIQAYAFQNSRVQSVKFAEGGNADLQIGYASGNNSYSSAFSYSAITEIKLPSRLTAFYSSTFSYSNLESITIPAKVKTVAMSAFSGCTSLKTVQFEGGSSGLELGITAFSGCTSIETLVIPANVTSIGNYAFQNMTKLSEITFADGIKLRSLGENVFSGCTALTTITIPDTVTALPKNTFLNCTSLTTVNLPGGMQTIDFSAFTGCTALKDINFPDDAVNFKTVDGVVFNKAGTTLYYYPVSKTDESYRVPNTVTTIAASAFRRNAYVQSITIPKSVTSIGMVAFADCTSLSELKFEDGTSDLRIESGNVDSLIKNTLITELSFPARLKFIGEYAFYNSEQLTKVTFAPNSRLTNLGGSSFSYTPITEISLPASLVTIGTNVFYGCKSLQKATFEGNNVSNIGMNMFYGCSALKSVVLPGNVLTIGSSAFSGCEELIEITIPVTVQSIGASAFQNNYSLQRVIFAGQSVKSVGNYAFNNCYSLTEIDLPDAVETIGIYAFFGCKSLESVHLSEKLTEIPVSLFQGDVALSQINFPATLESIGNYAFQNTAVTLVSLFDRVKTIGQYAFDGAARLKEVRMQYGITSIGDYAFRGCSSLTSMEIPASVVTLGINPFGGVPAFSLAADNTSFKMVDGALYNGDMTTLLAYPSTKTGHITLPDTVTSIGAGAFAGSAISGITLPAGLTVIPESLFANCVNLTSVTLPERVTVIGDNAFRNSGITGITFGGYLTTIGNYAFSDCTALKEVNFRLGPNERLPLTIGNYAFSGCTSLKSVDIPRRTRTQVVYVSSIQDAVAPGIGDYAFNGCTSLTHLTFGEDTAAEPLGSYLTIGRYAFSGCTSLSEVTLPDYLDNYYDMFGQSGGDRRGLDRYAFSGCTSLAKVTFGDSYYYVYQTYIFQNCTSLKEVVFSEKMSSISTGMFQNTGFETITIPSHISIGASAFADCAQLKSVTVNGMSIGQTAFANCGKLESVALNGKIKSIDMGAFKNCTSIKSITIPASVTNIGADAFAGWTQSQVINIQAAQAPDGWNAGWNNECNAQIIWDYKG